MGWYLRKAINFGPLRLNLSKSGVGVSVGAKGARISFGPHGTCFHGGRYGVYFRERLDGTHGDHSPDAPPDAVDEHIEEIKTADASDLVDPDQHNLVREINVRQARMALGEVTLVLGGLLTAASCILATRASPLWWIAGFLMLITTGIATYLAHKRDIDRKTVTLTFELNGESSAVYNDLKQSLSLLEQCSHLWRVTTRASTDDWKHNAGANCLVSRKQVHMEQRLPPYLESNITPYAISLGNQTLHFLPNGLFVYQGRTVGVLSYGSVLTQTGSTEFREEGGVPPDAMAIGTTWRYVNRDGGPDRRFRDNSQIPICRYGELTLTSDTGLRIVLMTSVAHIPDEIVESIRRMSSLRQRCPSKSVNLAIHPGIEFHCHKCGRLFRVSSTLAGKSAKCKGCGMSLVIPSP